MSPILFASTFTLNSAALAAWFTVRFPHRCPEDLKPIILHAVGAMVALQVSAAAIGFGEGDRTETLATVLGVGLPALTYAFLVGLWTIRLMTGAVRGLPR